MFEHKKVFVLGMARSGFEVAKLLSNNNEIIVTDLKEQDSNDVKELSDLNIPVIVTEKPEELLDKTFNYVIKNPGIRNDHPVVLKAIDLGIKVINEVEVAYHFLPAHTSIIGITGSNGKTTTTTIIYEILKHAKKDAYLGGNIGIPLSKLVREMKEDGILVIEISDHQLCNMENFKTDISILTNLSEVHLDFHGTYDNYKMIKKRIFNNHTVNELAIINMDDADSIQLTEDIISKKEYFSRTKLADAYLKENIIYYHNDPVINIDDIKIKGNHNYENIMCAIIATKKYGVTNDEIKEVLKNFNGVPHRIEYVKEVNNRTFYNDSKSTNTLATVTALSSFNSPTILIMGGLDRGHSFDSLIPYLNNTKLVICYGETKNRIKEFCDNNHVSCQVVDNLKEATLKAYELSNEKDIILLSPACASWDQYKCFEDRGNEFKNIVNELE